MTPDEESVAAALMRRAQSGDAEAYAELLSRLATTATRFVRNRAGAVPWVDDAVQETLMAVHRARHTWDPARPLAPWFYAIAGFKVIDSHRRAQRVARRETADDGVEAMPAPATSADEVDVDAIRAALAHLPPRQRDIIEGLKLRDESVRHLAAKHAMSESAVKVMAHRGYKRLRALLGGETERPR